MTQHQIILNYLRDLNDWQFEYKIRGVNTEYGFIGARGDRDVRQLVRDGKLERRLEGKFCQVRYPLQQEYREDCAMCYAQKVGVFVSPHFHKKVESNIK